MNKVVKITEDKIFVGQDDGSLLETDRTNANYDVKVGDVVEVYSKDDLIIINKISDKNPTKSNKNNIKLSKILSITFSIIFSFFLISFIVISVLPHGKVYTYEMSDGEDYYRIKLTFSEDIVTSEISFSYTIDPTNPNDNNSSEQQERINSQTFIIGPQTVSTGNKVIKDQTTDTYKYKIIDKELYFFSGENEEGEGSYIVVGKITSTSLTYKYDSDDNYKIANFEEKTMSSLKNASLILTILFGAIDLIFIVFYMLNKKTTKSENN